MNSEEIASRLDDMITSEKALDTEQLLNLHHEVLTCNARFIIESDRPDNKYKHLEHFLRHAILLHALGYNDQWKSQLEAARVVAMTMTKI